MEEKNSGFHPVSSEDLDLGKLLDNLVEYVAKYGKILAISTLLGIVIAIVLYKLMPRYYTARLLVQSTVLDNHNEEEILENWDGLLNRYGYAALSQTLHYPAEKLENIGSFNIELVTGPINDGVTSFVIEVETKDTAGLQDLQGAIVYGLENSEYVRQKVQIRKEGLQQQIQKAGDEVTKLDSSRKYIQSLLQGPGKGSPELIVDISKVSEERVEIQEKLTGYKEKLAFVNGIQVVQDFVRTRKVKPSRSLFFLSGLLAGFLLGYVITLALMATANYKKRHA